MATKLFLATLVMLVGVIAQAPRKKTPEPRPGVTINPAAFIAKRYYPGRDGAALEAGSRPLVQHNNTGHGRQHGAHYRELGQALVAACRKSVQVAEVTRLLEAGADPSFLDDAGGQSGSKGHNTPLLQAIRADDADKVGLLLSAGAHATRPQRNGNLPLIAAARRGKPAVVSALIQHGVNVDDQHDVSGQTALHVAAKLGHVGVVALLCEAGADVNIGEQGDGATPLHLAARYNHAPVVSKLLEFGAHASMESTWRDASGKVGTPDHHAGSSKIRTMLAAAARDAASAKVAAAAAAQALKEL